MSMYTVPSSYTRTICIWPTYPRADPAGCLVKPNCLFSTVFNNAAAAFQNDIKSFIETSIGKPQHREMHKVA